MKNRYRQQASMDLIAIVENVIDPFEKYVYRNFRHKKTPSFLQLGVFYLVNEYFLNATRKLGDNLLSLILTINYHWRVICFTCEFGM